MKSKRMPTTMVLMAGSWLIVVWGLLVGILQCGFPVWTRITIILGSVIVAAVVRALGNICEFLFNLTHNINDNFTSLKQLSGQNLSAMQQEIHVFDQNLKSVEQALQQIGSASRELEQDTNDIRQNIQNIWRLFANIKDTLEK